MKLLVLSILLILSGASDLIQTIKTDAVDFEVDELGFVYAIHKDRIVKMYPDGKFFYEFSFKNAGRIGRLDVYDPLKPLVYFSETGDLQVLDNTMSRQRDVINLYSYGFGEVSCLAASVDHNYWIFERSRGELLRLNGSFEEITSTGNIVQLLGENPNPVLVKEHNNHVFLCDTTLGIYVFDIFGGFVQKISGKGITSLSATDDLVVFCQSDTLFAHHLRFKTKEIVMVGDKRAEKMSFRNGKIYVLGQGKLEIYALGNNKGQDQE